MSSSGPPESAGPESEPSGPDDARSEARVRVLSVSWDDTDRMRTLTWVVVIGTAITVGLAIFGLPQTHFPPAPTWQFGIVVPTHGMTRAGVALVRGQPGEAWLFNPAIFLIAGLVLFAGYRWVARAVAGRWLNVSITFTRWVWLGLALALIALWINQQSNADVIIVG